MRSSKGRKDYTHYLCELYDTKKFLEEMGREVWPMYSFSRPAYMFWNGVANRLRQNGFSDEDIKTWLQSKMSRWSLDSGWDETIEQLGFDLAKDIKKLHDYGKKNAYCHSLD